MTSVRDAGYGFESVSKRWEAVVNDEKSCENENEYEHEYEHEHEDEHEDEHEYEHEDEHEDEHEHEDEYEHEHEHEGEHEHGEGGGRDTLLPSLVWVIWRSLSALILRWRLLRRRRFQARAVVWFPFQARVFRLRGLQRLQARRFPGSRFPSLRPVSR